MRIFSPARAAACLLLLATLSFAAEPQVIRLERFRKALWKVHVTFQGKPGDFLFDTGGGRTLFSKSYAASTGCKFWGRVTGYNMFGERGDAPRCDDAQLRVGDTALTPVTAGTLDFGDRFAGDKAPDGLLSLDAFDGKA
ncbi:MAG TPA: aspartyl protease family protein, partial [Bryobacteraceae bacterium]|nr:aspartyl protease family protein [Bryobacteraceae bacterium]